MSSETFSQVPPAIYSPTIAPKRHRTAKSQPKRPSRFEQEGREEREVLQSTGFPTSPVFLFKIGSRGQKFQAVAASVSEWRIEWAATGSGPSCSIRLGPSGCGFAREAHANTPRPPGTPLQPDLCIGNNHRWTQMDTDSEAPIQHRAARNQAHRLVGDGRGLPHLCASVSICGSTAWFRLQRGSRRRLADRDCRWELT